MKGLKRMFPVNISKIPFSRYGSYLSVSGDPRNPDDKSLYINNLHGEIDMRKIFKIELKSEYQIDFKPWLLTIYTKDGDINIYMRGSEEIVLFGDCKRFCLSYSNAGKTGYIFPILAGKAYRIVDRRSRFFGQLQIIKGEAELNTEWRPMQSSRSRLICQYADVNIKTDNQFLVWYRIEELESKVEENLNIETAREIEQIKKEYKDWVSVFPAYIDKYNDSAKLAKYILWSSVVKAKGYVTRNGILMSKNWMCSIWSWDNCFNAMALAPYHPKLAFDQLLLIMDNQCENGKLPDRVNDRDRQAIYTKPPVYGWAFKRMLERGFNADTDTLLYFRDKLIKALDWWFTYRDDDKDGICQYNHGNESGWDNSTAFDYGVPIESPDLTALILLNLKMISFLSKKLDDAQMSQKYDELYKNLSEKFYKHFFVNGLPQVVFNHSHEQIVNGSALKYISIILGEYLEPDIFNQLAYKIENEFLAPYGVTTEALKSPKFRDGNSYWRGPAWAPQNYQIADGLRRGGNKKLAKEIAERFCNAIVLQEAAHENYDAHTGLGFDDPSYTWTASVFILFLDEYFRK